MTIAKYISTMKVTDLRLVCKKLNLPVSGNKKVLINRLANHLPKINSLVIF